MYVHNHNSLISESRKKDVERGARGNRSDIPSSPREPEWPEARVLGFARFTRSAGAYRASNTYAPNRHCEAISVLRDVPKLPDAYPVCCVSCFSFGVTR